MANVIERRRKQQQKSKALKKQLMYESGGESRYAARKSARNHGAPMATRERMPWWYAEFSRLFANA